jgi:hypothetical protein
MVLDIQVKLQVAFLMFYIKYVPSVCVFCIFFLLICSSLLILCFSCHTGFMAAAS